MREAADAPATQPAYVHTVVLQMFGNECAFAPVYRVYLVGFPYRLQQWGSKYYNSLHMPKAPKNTSFLYNIAYNPSQLVQIRQNDNLRETGAWHTFFFL